MPTPISRPPYVPGDVLTPERDITHRHFRPGDQVAVFKGVAGRKLWGDSFKVVTSSWHTPTDEDGWRLLDPNGGERSYITAHPRYLVHLSRRCADCLIYLRALEDYLLPQLSTAGDVVDCGWYSLTHLNQLVHVNDARGDR
ncbi:hypothetical protein ACWDBF_07885 [Streptomyces angustmyceticus]|uniref:hypothetical protein n=1 Tax=Streptomyces TaxID=1883 RepID=UPI001F509D7A|nr:hypothetical protein [Streptomyces lydicus]MCZ1006853.1 hypothetical protein [Streptomyces lydicus]